MSVTLVCNQERQGLGFLRPTDNKRAFTSEKPRARVQNFMPQIYSIDLWLSEKIHKCFEQHQGVSAGKQQSLTNTRVVGEDVGLGERVRVDEGLVDAEERLVSAGADPRGTATVTRPDPRHEPRPREPRAPLLAVPVVLPTQLVFLRKTGISNVTIIQHFDHVSPLWRKCAPSKFGPILRC